MTSEDTEEKEPKPKTLKEKTYVLLFCILLLLYSSEKMIDTSLNEHKALKDTGAGKTTK